MKKTLLAVAIPTLLIANTANAYELINEEGKFVDFYGHLRTQIEKNDGQDVSINAGASRAGVSAKYAVNNDLDVVGTVEFGVGYTEGSYDMQNRLHYAGFSTQAGTFTFGRQWISTEDVWGADYSYNFGGSGIGGVSEFVSGGRHDSSIKYVYEGESFWVNGTFGLSEDDTNNELAELYAGTSFGGLSLHVGGGTSRDKDFATVADVENTFFEGTAEYSFGAATIGLTYINGSAEQKDGPLSLDSDNIMLAGMYSLNSQASIYGGYELTNYDVNTGRSEDYTVAYLGTVYHLNSWSRAFVEVGYSDGTAVGYTNEDSDLVVDAGEHDGETSFIVGYRVYW
ncbi:porin [Photobacterium halotolerans]|uniref:Porin n=1 Tax=Photobacterium halotolerans TaxID=265726 RepID=A0A7X4WD87_9GAMM|nr:porin [Photobacterium halotolerans]NAW66568.1 porin [Photobacterium halotolerans]